MADLKPRDTITTCLNDITRDETNGVAGLVFVAIDKHGEQIAAQASGTIGLDTKEPMTTETVFWIASCTKVLTVIACLQAVEKQQLALDDHEQVYNLCPELRAVKVLQDDGSLVDKKQDITLRRLLSHTAGFGYELWVIMDCTARIDVDDNYKAQTINYYDTADRSGSMCFMPT
jgi:CubicO group peptidase (beta-lactamase class C family)